MGYTNVWRETESGSISDILGSGQIYDTVLRPIHNILKREVTFGYSVDITSLLVPSAQGVINLQEPK